MIKKASIFLLFLILLSAPLCLKADGTTPPPPSKKKGNFTEGTFSNNNKWNKDGVSTTPPDPAMATGGNKIPISGGNFILIVGGMIYFYRKTKKAVITSQNVKQ